MIVAFVNFSKLEKLSFLMVWKPLVNPHVKVLKHLKASVFPQLSKKIGLSAFVGVLPA